MTIKLTKKANKATDRKTMFTAIYSLNKSFIGSITHTQTRSFYPFFPTIFGWKTSRHINEIKARKIRRIKQDKVMNYRCEKQLFRLPYFPPWKAHKFLKFLICIFTIPWCMVDDCFNLDDWMVQFETWVKFISRRF